MKSYVNLILNTWMGNNEKGAANGYVVLRLLFDESSAQIQSNLLLSTAY